MAHHRRYPRRRTPDMIPDFIYYDESAEVTEADWLKMKAILKDVKLPCLQTTTEDSKGCCVYEKPEVFTVVGFMSMNATPYENFVEVRDAQRKADARRYTDHGPPNPN